MISKVYMMKLKRKGIARFFGLKMLMIKRIISLLLCVVLLVGCVNVGVVNASAATTTTVLTALAKKFPNGKYWNHVGSKNNNPDGCTSKPCDHHGKKKDEGGCGYLPGDCECNSFLNAIQCMGFAYKSAYDIVGTNPREWEKITTLTVSDLRVGDIIRYINNTHSVTVVGVKGDTVAYVGANWGANCLIKWGKLKKDEIKGFSYVLHDPSNNRKNSDINIYEKVAGSGGIDEPVQQTETWKMSPDSSLNVRASASVSAAAVGSIPKGASFTVTKKVNSADYLWGYVSYAGINGWAALNYSQYISGSYAVPSISSVPANIVAGASFNVSFSAVSGAESYNVCVYGADSKLYLSKTVTGTTAQLAVTDPGKYTVKVTALNSKAPSWKATGNACTLNIVSSSTEVEKITLLSTLTLAKGSVYTLTPTFIPYGTKDELIWSSSNPGVASVSENGVITAKGYGTARISCTSKKNASVNAFTDVTVSTAPVQNLRQVDTKTNANSAVIKWDKVSGASGYAVYSYGTQLQLIGKTKSNYLKISNLQSNTSLKVAVYAYVTSGGKDYLSALSAPFTLTTSPAAVTSVRVTDIKTESSVLRWKETAGADSYEVYKYVKGKGYVLLAETKHNYYKMRGKAGTVYKLRVKAVNKIGDRKLFSAVSDCAYLVFRPAQASFSAVSEKNAATLKWKKVKGASGYEVYMSTPDGYKKIKTLSASATSLRKTGLKSNTAYKFKVRAYTKAGTTIAYGSYATVKVKIK